MNFSLTKRFYSSAKKFWKSVSVEKDASGPLTKYNVLLDGKIVKMAGTSLSLENEHLAYLLAAEWGSIKANLGKDDLLLNGIYVNSLTSDASNRAKSTSELLKYLQFDTVKYFDYSNEKLYKAQDEKWHPLISWFGGELVGDGDGDGGSSINLPEKDSLSASPMGSDEAAKSIDFMNCLEPLRFSAFDRLVRESKSFIIPFAFLKGRLEVEDAIDAALLETAFQTNQWGEFPESHELERLSLKTLFAGCKTLLEFSSGNEKGGDDA